MKFVTLLLLLGLGIVTLLARPKLPIALFPSPAPTSSSKPPLSSIYSIDGYSIQVQPVRSTDTITLIPNFSEKNTAASIVAKNNCRYGINGGFYTTEQKPLGYFYAHGKTYSNTFHTSSLLSGTVAQIKGKMIDTAPHFPQDAALDFAFQSGPFFHPGDQLTFSQDEQDRRIILAVNDTTQYFIAITQANNVYAGPLLSELPQLLQKLHLQLTRAINLDGGSASAFFSESGIKLEEITPVGSFLCAK